MSKNPEKYHGEKFLLERLVGLVLKGGARGTAAAAAAVGTQLPAPTNANIDPISKPPPFCAGSRGAFSLLSVGQHLFKNWDLKWVFRKFYTTFHAVPIYAANL